MCQRACGEGHGAELQARRVRLSRLVVKGGCSRRGLEQGREPAASSCHVGKGSEFEVEMESLLVANDDEG